MSFFKEFKEFAARGNVVDMAVGVVVGGAFGKIVSSLVADIITPLISTALGDADLTNLSVQLKPGSEGVEPLLLKYGVFLQNILDFLIIALVIFTFIKLMNNLKKKEAEAPAPEPVPEAPSNEEVLLQEIRDILKNK